MAGTTRACRGLARRFPVNGTQLLDLWEADKGHDGTTGGSVSSWRSQGRAQRHLSQATAGKKPTFQRLGSFGTARMAFDGGDCIHGTGAGLDNLVKCGMLVVVRCSSQNGTYILSEPDTTAGGNGVDISMQNLGGFIGRTKTNLTTLALNTSADVHSGSQALFELSCDMTRSTQDNSITASGGGWGYGTLSGGALDADSATIAIGDFSNAGFSLPWTGDVLAAAVLAEGLSPGQRRRTYRWSKRRWGTPIPIDKWQDGTFLYAL